MAQLDKHILHLPATAAAGTDARFCVAFPADLAGNWHLAKGSLVGNATTAAHATNVAVITVYGSDADGASGGTAQASWDTTTGADGAITVGVVNDLTLAGGATATFAAGDIIEVFIDESGGTGAAVSGNIALSFDKLL